MENPEKKQAIIDLVDEVVGHDEDLDPQGTVASVARDFLSAEGVGLIFGDETTKALEGGDDLTPNSPDAVNMSLRYNDPLTSSAGRMGQMEILELVRVVSSVARDILARRDVEKDGTIEDVKQLVSMLSDKEREIQSVSGRMMEKAINGDEPVERSVAQEAQIFAGSLKRRIDLDRKSVV